MNFSYFFQCLSLAFSVVAVYECLCLKGKVNALLDAKYNEYENYFKLSQTVDHIIRTEEEKESFRNFKEGQQ